MKIDVMTLFPGMFAGVLGESIVKRGIEAGALQVELHNFRERGIGRHRKVDDAPYGGGPGLVLMPGPVLETLDEIEGKQHAEASGTEARSTEARSTEAPGPEASSTEATSAAEKKSGKPVRRVLFSPQGRPLTQAVVRELAAEERLILLCGHYEGFDERIRTLREWDEISVGDYVLTGGELPAMVVIDAVSRLLPGVLGDAESAGNDSFEEGLLEYPQYTRPPEYEGAGIPEVLLSGHHGKIAAWRREQAEARTKQRRPDLWRRYEEDRASGSA